MEGTEPRPVYVQPTPILMVNQSSGSATAGLVLGIISIILTALSPILGFLCCIVSVPMAILGVIFSHIGYSHSKNHGVGTGNAVAGLVLNWLTIIATVLAILGILLLGFSLAMVE